MGGGSAGSVPGVAKLQGLLVVSVLLQGAALALHQAATTLALRCATALALYLAAIAPALHRAATAVALSCATALALHQAATAPALRHVTALILHQGLQLPLLLDVQHACVLTSVVGERRYTPS